MDTKGESETPEVFVQELNRDSDTSPGLPLSGAAEDCSNFPGRHGPTHIDSGFVGKTDSIRHGIIQKGAGRDVWSPELLWVDKRDPTAQDLVWITWLGSGLGSLENLETNERTHGFGGRRISMIAGIRLCGRSMAFFYFSCPGVHHHLLQWWQICTTARSARDSWVGDRICVNLPVSVYTLCWWG